MIRFLRKPGRWAVCFGLMLTCAFVFVLLDTFVIPRVQAVVEAPRAAETSHSGGSGSQTSSVANDSGGQDGTSPQATQPPSAPVITETSYVDSNIQINIETLRIQDTSCYIADIKITDITYLKTALASNLYGRNIKQTTSKMAADHGALLAINGDYYGYRDSGFVLRNGVLYRSSDRGQALVIDSAGNLSVVDESASDAQALLEAGAWQILSFGPALIDNSIITVDESSEVTQSSRSNPRTAIAQAGDGHYIFFVSDGRTSQSDGLSLLEVANILAERGCTVAYNLDGGGSSTMVFNGTVINNPSSGHSQNEREVSDIVYIGYE